jgi:hypothetical protein
MMVTSAQHVDCYEVRVGKGDAPWQRSSRPADPGSCDCLPGYADPVRTAGTKSKALAFTELPFAPALALRPVPFNDQRMRARIQQTRTVY